MYNSLEKLCREAVEKNIEIWKLIQLEDCKEENISEEESFSMMKKMYLAMKESDKSYDEKLKSSSGLVGGEAAKVEKALDGGRVLSGAFIGKMMARALKVAESNACMKRIVASPTAGSCGVVPAVLITMQEEFSLSDDDMTKGLYVAAGIGGVIALRASLSGAEGGCQAEIGSASSMAAGAATFLRGGSYDEIMNASAIALKGLLGLACDPVAGLVEVPCVKRNVIGAVNAITSSDMAMAGIESKIPVDEVFDAMKAIGRCMSMEIRESGLGGLAATNRGQEIKEENAKF